MHRTAEEISTATTVIIVVEDAAPEAGRTPLQTERSSPRTRVRMEETRLTSGNETTTKRDHAAGVSTAGHPPGLDAAAVHHPHGITNLGTSLKRGGMRSIEKSLAMARRGGDPAVDDALGTDAGLTRTSQKAKSKKNEENVASVIRKKAGMVKSVHLKIAAVVVPTTADILDVLAGRTGKVGKKTMNPNQKTNHRLQKPTAPRPPNS